MAVTIAELTARFPGVFDALGVGAQLAIDEAILRVNRAAFGRKADMATLYLAAHLASGMKPSAAAGAATGGTVGRVTINFAAAAAGADDYDSSIYGRLYKALINSTIVGFRVARGGG